MTRIKETFFKNIIEKLTKRPRVMVLACSGGADSMVLLDILWKAQKHEDIIVAHVNHGLRDSAIRDEKIVATYCKKHKFTLEVLQADIKKEAKKTKTTIEECARNIRKKWLEEMRIKHHADIVTTAHHSDDQAETLLYRITKWTGITGLVGIEWETEYYARPLIWVTKSEILDYAKKNKIPYWHDETNDDTTIPRNLLRHEVLPKLQAINPEVTQSLMRLSQSARELKMSFDTFFREALETKSFTLDWYHSLPLGFQHEFLRCLYELSNASTHGLSTALIAELDRFLSTRTGGKKEIKKMKLEKKQWRVYLTIK
jgi:tRNA(Ile)-lysidine synthase